MPNDQAGPDNIERLFLGLPRERLPGIVDTREQWAEEMAQKVRRASGDETLGVTVALIGEPVLSPDRPHSPDDTIGPSDNPLGGTTLSGASADFSGAAFPGLRYVQTEPVVVVTLDTSKLSEVPDWVRSLEVRVVDRPTAQLIPSSYGGIDSTPPDAPRIPGNGSGAQSTFDASLGSAATLAIIAGGFGAAYYLFGPESGGSDSGASS